MMLLQRAYPKESWTVGQTALSFVLLVSGIILLVGTTLAFFALSFLNTSSGMIASSQATAVASAGANDGVLQLVRNKDFSSAGYAVPLVFQGVSYTANVTVAQNSPAIGQATVFSVGTVGVYTRQMRVVASVVSTTGQIDVISWQ